MNDEDSDMVKPNTGIHLDSLPYIMILALVVLGAGMMIVKSRRRREE
jgi:LPXTG-motif cell wall-anchored protein